MQTAGPSMVGRRAGMEATMGTIQRERAGLQREFEKFEKDEKDEKLGNAKTIEKERRLLRWIVTVVASLVVVLSVSVRSQSSNDSARATFMRAHFGEAIVLHDAVARGDVPAAREQATRLAAHQTAVRFPTGAHAFFGLMQLEAGTLREAPTVEAMAPIAASLLSRCGQCHAAMHVRVAVPTAPDAGVGGLVGQMAAHQRAADALLEGLIGPSTSSWETGVRSIAALELDKTHMPTAVLRERATIARARLSAVVAEAVAATRPPDRARAYGHLLSICAQCHRERPTVWGPQR
ncbi:MAG TPA: hypothetical protein VMF13_21930 [Luteitalea sp.]|nr:hypothetical protein [Luteitalea sp.]